MPGEACEESSNEFTCVASTGMNTKCYFAPLDEKDLLERQDGGRDGARYGLLLVGVGGGVGGKTKDAFGDLLCELAPICFQGYGFVSHHATKFPPPTT